MAPMRKLRQPLDSNLPVLGWREWVSLPEWDIPWIKVKADTGARTSALHVSDIQILKSGSKKKVRFVVHPKQRSQHPEKVVEARLIEHREVRSSDGILTLRPVVETEIRIGPHVFRTEVTLVNRDMMGFRMLLGRQALKSRFLVDSGRSYLFAPQKESK